jgi:hypothetical protein
MAMELITTIQRFVGLAADVATLPVTDIYTGSKFTALDTGARYIFNGAAWVADLTDIAVTAKSLSAANDTVNAGYYAATTLSAIDTDLATANIKATKTIFGVAGKAEVVDTTEAGTPVTANGDIALGKIAWANGTKFTGTHV